MCTTSLRYRPSSSLCISSSSSCNMHSQKNTFFCLQSTFPECSHDIQGIRLLHLGATSLRDRPSWLLSRLVAHAPCILKIVIAFQHTLRSQLMLLLGFLFIPRVNCSTSLDRYDNSNIFHCPFQFFSFHVHHFHLLSLFCNMSIFNIISFIHFVLT